MKSIYQNSNRVFVILFSCILSFSGCKKFIEVEPPVTSVNEGNVYLEDATAAAAVTSIYSRMADAQFSKNMSIYPELYADNLTLFSNSIEYAAYYKNGLDPNVQGNVVFNFWNPIFPYIYQANAAIEGLSKSKTLTEAVKQTLLGEAYFLRAFHYYYLTTLYGNVPLALSTDYQINNRLPRSSASQVFQQIVSDLKQAQSMLGNTYLKGDALAEYDAGNEERVRPNKFAATALLARVFLDMKEWANAEQAATEVINMSTLFSILPLEQVFLKNSKETIWALQTVASNTNTAEGDLFILRPEGPNNNGQPVYLSNNFITSFQSGDQRKIKWTGNVTVGTIIYPYAAKYKEVAGNNQVTEYSVVLRLAEQYLIRAEARIQQSHVTEGIADLNVLRDRAIDKNEPNADKRLKLLSLTLSKEQAYSALLYEQRVEEFCEWGHRFIDLKRTGHVDAVLKSAEQLKGSSWESYKAVFPIPSNEIRINGALTQNDGYSK